MIQETLIAPESRASGLQVRALASPRLGSELKIWLLFHFFIFLGSLEGLAEIKCRAPHAIDATLSPGQICSMALTYPVDDMFAWRFTGPRGRGDAATPLLTSPASGIYALAVQHLVDITLRLELQGQFGPARLHNPTIAHDVHEVRLDVVQ